MQTVKVRLRKPTRVFTFLSEDISLQRNENCIVRSDRGLEFGICILPPEDCPEEAKSRYKMTVVRKVTHNDESTYHQILIDEQKAKELCADRIRQHNLPMKLVDVEYTFDKHKVVFYFTSADRVDFRHLVRDLAQDLKTRIELRHIQVRDEAKLVGGLGMCGRELCCSTWLREFKPISMKMAKRQNLSLNPSKISGQCGRLLCCLSYENELYKEAKKADLAARAAKEEAEPEIVEAFGHEAAFGDLPYPNKPADWEDRLREVADLDDEDLGVISDLEDEDEHPSAVVELLDVSETVEGPIPPAQKSASEHGTSEPNRPPPRDQEDRSHGGHRGKRRRRRRGGRGGGGGGAPQSGQN